MSDELAFASALDLAARVHAREVSPAELTALFVEPASEEQIIPEKSTWYQRFAWKWLTGRKR